MKFTALFTLVAIAIPALAAPANELEKRELSIRVCENDNWRDPCVTYNPPWNVCQPFSVLGLNGYRSFGPNSGSTCIWYTGAGCTGTPSDNVYYPGYAVVPGFWTFNTASFKCWN